jgi:DNA polymerase-3 subunit beta
MKLTLKAKELQSAISSIQSICSKKTISETTSMTFLSLSDRQLIIRATDFESFIQINIEPKDIKQESTDYQKELIINAKRLYDIIRDIEPEENIDLSSNDQGVQIKTARSEINLTISSITTDQITLMNNKTETIENFASINTQSIISALSYCTPLATSALSSNSHNGSIHIVFEISGKITISSTDGHSLAHVAITSETINPIEKISFTISKRAAIDLKKIIECSEKNSDLIIGKSGKNIAFSGQSFTNIIKVINEPAPSYEKIINAQPEKSFECDKSEIQKSIRRISSLTVGKFIPASFNFEDETEVLIKINHSEIGSAREVVKMKRVKEKITNNSKTDKEDSKQKSIFNIYPPYVLQAISSLPENDEGMVKISFTNFKKPIYFSFEKTNTTMIYVVMPMINQQ